MASAPTTNRYAYVQRGQVERHARQQAKPQHHAHAEHREAEVPLRGDGFPLRADDERDRRQRQPDKRRAEHIHARVEHLREHGRGETHADDPADAQFDEEAERLSTFARVAPEQRVQRMDELFIKP